LNNLRVYWNLFFFLATSAWSALEIFTIMRYINLHLHLHLMNFTARPLRFTCTAESRTVSAAAELQTFDVCLSVCLSVWRLSVATSGLSRGQRGLGRLKLPHRCWSNCSHAQTLPGVLSGVQHRLSGTRCHKQFWSATLCLFLNPDLGLKLCVQSRFYWTPIRPAASACEIMTAWRSRKSIIIIIIIINLYGRWNGTGLVEIFR